jgi:hypothetical protein
MPWKYITQLMGDGSLWSRSQHELLAFIAKAEEDGRPDAAEHLPSMPTAAHHKRLQPPLGRIALPELRPLRQQASQGNKATSRTTVYTDARMCLLWRGQGSVP